LASGVFRIGAAAGKRLEWDNSTLTVVSDFVTIDANGITMPISGNSTPTTTSAYRFTQANGKLGVFGFTPISNVAGISLNSQVTSGSDQGAYAILNAQGWASGASRAQAYVLAESRHNTTPNVDISAPVVHVTLRSNGGGEQFTLWDTSNNPVFRVDNNGAVFERARLTAAMGTWTTPSFSAGHYTANGSMTWTVASGDSETYAYTLVGKTMTVAWRIVTTTVGGTPNTELRIAIPGGFTSAKKIEATHHYSDNGATGTGIAEVNAGGTTIVLFKAAFAAWSASTDNTFTLGQITFEIQ
jgi:hypothetical protein